MLRSVAFVCFCIAFASSSEAAEEISLAFPLNCQVGRTCFIQSYVDHGTSERPQDYQCGGRTYARHDGTDIRLPDLDAQRKGVEVLAAASGVVAKVRDGMEDVSVKTTGGVPVVGKECGNGAVVEHDNGWQTQYCHLAKGSVRLKPGDRVITGQPIGLVGLSGETEFPHLHFTVRRDRNIVDPFAYGAPLATCGSGHSIWNAPVREQTRYMAREVLNFGFADAIPTMDLIEGGEIAVHPVTRASEAIVAYVRVIGLQSGDQQTLTIKDSQGVLLSEYKAPALDHDKAQYLISAGRKRAGVTWSERNFVATYRVLKDGAEVLQKTFEVTLK